jgi:glycerol kinase
MPHLLAIDQGTTSSRAILFDGHATALKTSQAEFTQYFPQNGWVEHDPEEIWKTTFDACNAVMSDQVKAIGITNQRETTIVWDRQTGKPIYPAIVWQDRRTSDYCERLKAEGHEATISAKTGLLLDPYFSATKLAWILDNVEGARRRAEKGKLAFGTVDSFLLWRLTEGRSHATDVTNASRTMLYNIHTRTWDPELLTLFTIPESLLPEVKPCVAEFGYTTLFGKSIPIGGIAGDQQAAAIGQGCIAPGMTKSTYGTGCFMLVNTGEKPIASTHRLLTTVAYDINGITHYALEGSIFIAGAAVQWLRDKLHFFEKSSQTEALVQQADAEHGVVVVPAFTGLGAPHWKPNARGAILGLTRDSGIPEITRATLESLAYQTKELCDAIAQDGMTPSRVRVDGGMVANNWFCQYLSDTLALTLDRPVIHETTALGVAYLAGLYAGIYPDIQAIANSWQCERTFTAGECDRKGYEQWKRAVRMVGELYSDLI